MLYRGQIQLIESNAPTDLKVAWVQPNGLGSLTLYGQQPSPEFAVDRKEDHYVKEPLAELKTGENLNLS